MNRVLLKKLQAVKPPADLSTAFGAVNSVDARYNISDALKVVGLDWETKIRPVCMADKNHTHIKGYFATYRSDTNFPLGVVKSRYRPNQNADRFLWLHGPLTRGQAEGKSEFPKIEFGGCINGGAQVYLGVNLGEFEHPSGSRFTKIMWISDSSDKSTNYTIHAFAHDSVTQSIYNLHDPMQSFKIRHTEGSKVKLAVAQARIQWAIEELDAFIEHVTIMEKITCTAALADTMIYEVLGVSKAAVKDWWSKATPEDIQPQWVNQYETIQWLLKTKRGETEKPLTIFDVYQAINTYYDQYRTVRGTGKKADVVTDSKLLGISAKRKARAYAVCRTEALKNFKKAV